MQRRSRDSAPRGLRAVAPSLLGATAIAFVLASFNACGSGGGPGGQAASDAGPEGGATVDSSSHPLCVNGQSVDGAYPKVGTSLELLSTIPNLSWAGLDETGNNKLTVTMADYFEPCAAKSRLLVLRVTTGWCGTCRYDLAHTKSLTGNATFGARLRWLDLQIADEDGNPATVDDLARHQGKMDEKTRIVAAPAYEVSVVAPSQAVLPVYILIDTRTMQIRNLLSDPDPAQLSFRVAQELTLLDGAPAPPYPDQPLTDARFSPNEWALLQETTVPVAPPPDPTNEKSDDAAAAALGKSIFADKSLSPTGTVSCASCHDATKAFTDRLPVSEGTAHVDRNAPSLGLAAFARWQFWDGRADSLWAQAAGPFEAKKEFGSSRLFVAHQIYANYKNQYEAVWSKHPLPDLSDAARFPANGMPGDAAFDAMPQADRDAVTRVLVNVAKSVAAFERTIRVKPNRLDKYIGGDLTAISPEEKKGLVAFVKLGCPQCHWGPRLTDDAFHTARFPTGRADGMPDRGRTDVVSTVLMGELTSHSVWSDLPAPHAFISHLASGAALTGAFKTPPLRGVAETAPYGHGGATTTLLDMAELYATAGLPTQSKLTIGDPEPWLPKFDASSAPDLVPFLQALTAEPYAP